MISIEKNRETYIYKGTSGKVVQTDDFSLSGFRVHVNSYQYLTFFSGR